MSLQRNNLVFLLHLVVKISRFIHETSFVFAGVRARFAPSVFCRGPESELVNVAKFTQWHLAT